VLTAPILLLAGSWLALLGSARSVRRSLRSEGAAHAVEARSTASRALLQMGARLIPILVLLAASLVAVILRAPQILDVMIAVVISSMVVVALLVRREARAGHAHRRNVAVMCLGLLEMLLIFTVVVALAPASPYSQAEWLGAGVWVLLLGIVPLARFAPGQVVGSAMFVGVFVVISHYGPLAEWGRPSQPTIERMQAVVADPQLDVDDIMGWQEYASLVTDLRALGHLAEPPASLRDEVRAAFRAAVAVGDAPHPTVLTAVARAGLAEPEDWRQLAALPGKARLLRRLLEDDGPLRKVGYAEYELTMLLAQGPLADSDRAHLVRRLDASLAAEETGAPLARNLMAVRWLDLLERGDRVEAAAPKIHGLLGRHQVRGDARRGGFTEFPVEVQSSQRGPTHDAVQLLVRVGAPEGVDRRSLRRYLETEQALYPQMHRITELQALQAFGDLLQVRRLGDPPGRSWWQVLVDERMLWALVGMVLLCLYAVWLAPAKLAPSRGGGAQP